MLKKIFKKNQLIITALAALLAVAGYLNYTEKNINDEAKQAAADKAQTEGTEKSTYSDDNTDDTANDNTDGDTKSETNGTEVADTNDIESNDVDVEGTPGEAIFVNASGTVDFIVEAKLAKEYARVSAQESLQLILDNESLSSEEKQAAVNKMVELTEISEREMAAENLIMAKGYSDVAVTMTDGYVDVIIVADELDMTERAQIEDIVKRKLQVEADKITINAIEVKTAN